MISFDSYENQVSLNIITRLSVKVSIGAAPAKTADAPKRISLKRKQVSELKVASSAGRKKTVTVEVRKRRSVRARPAADAGAADEALSPDQMEAAKRDLAEQAKRRHGGDRRGQQHPGPVPLRRKDPPPEDRDEGECEDQDGAHASI